MTTLITNYQPMVYRVLKNIYTLQAGDLLSREDSDNWFPFEVNLNLAVIVNHLWNNHREEYFEEVIETTKPRWKIGDKIVQLNCESYLQYCTVQSVSLDESSGEYWYNSLRSKWLRDPTPEELTTYFR